MRRIVMLLTILSLVAIIADYPSYTFGSIDDDSTIMNNNASSGAYNTTTSSSGRVLIVEDLDNIVRYNHTNGTAPYDALAKAIDEAFIHFEIAESSGNISKPSIAGSGRNLYIIYEDNGAGKSDVFVTTSRDIGETFDPPINLSMNLTGNSTNPEIGAAGDIAYIIFENDGVGNGDIFFGVSSTAGQNWTIYNVSNSTDPSHDSTLFVNEEGEYFVSWVERRDNGSVAIGYCGRPCW